MLLTADCDGAEITTLEGLADPVLHYNEDETTVVEADSVLMAAGQQVDLSFLGDYCLDSRFHFVSFSCYFFFLFVSGGFVQFSGISFSAPEATNSP